jgi:hypothetical protein
MPNIPGLAGGTPTKHPAAPSDAWLTLQASQLPLKLQLTRGLTQELGRRKLPALTKDHALKGLLPAGCVKLHEVVYSAVAFFNRIKMKNIGFMNFLKSA